MTQKKVIINGKEYKYSNKETVMITREIDKYLADVCKKFSEESKPRIPLNYIVEEGLRMYLKSRGIDI